MCKIGVKHGKQAKLLKKKLQVFINRCLRKILKIIWPEIISNKEFWEKSGQKQIKFEIKERKWYWIGHTLRKENGSIKMTALDWNPQGNRWRGRPRRLGEEEMMTEAKTIVRIAQLLGV